ncbi:MAG: hypothetical protein AAFV27_09130 [Pseudomonadota bacterium]
MSLLLIVMACGAPTPREFNQDPPRQSKDPVIRAQLSKIPSLTQERSGYYDGLEEIIAEYFPVGTSEALLEAFLFREYFDLVGDLGLKGPLNADISSRDVANGPDQSAILVSGCAPGSAINHVKWNREDGVITRIGARSERCRFPRGFSFVDKIDWSGPVSISPVP